MCTPDFSETHLFLKQQFAHSKSRVSKHFAWVPTWVYGTQHRYDYKLIWLKKYTLVEKWGIINAFNTGIYTDPIYGWITIAKYKI